LTFSARYLRLSPPLRFADAAIATFADCSRQELRRRCHFHCRQLPDMLMPPLPIGRHISLAFRYAADFERLRRLNTDDCDIGFSPLLSAFTATPMIVALSPASQDAILPAMMPPF